MDILSAPGSDFVCCNWRQFSYYRRTVDRLSWWLTLAVALIFGQMVRIPQYNASLTTTLQIDEVFMAAKKIQVGKNC